MAFDTSIPAVVFAPYIVAIKLVCNPLAGIEAVFVANR